MNLRSFHLFFITLSTLLAVGLALWTLDRWSAGGPVQYAVIGALSILGAMALVAYGLAFRRKSRLW